MSKEVILVTGGAGFIGSHLIEKLIELNHEVFVVDNLYRGSISNVHKNANFLELDLSKTSTYKKLPSKVDRVFHLAAQVSNEDSNHNPVLDTESNILSTLYLLLWSKEKKLKNFVFTSTVGVYADNLNQAVVEEDVLIPKGIYGINKRTCEEYIRIFSEEEGLSSNILRLFNVYGPGQNMHDLNQGMLSIYMSFLWKGEPIGVKGPLERERDFVYIDDVVNALLKVGFGTRYGETFNVCSGRKTSVREAINIIKNAFEVNQDYPVNILERTSRDIDSIYGNHKKLSNAFDWTPKVDLEEGIAKMVSWLKKVQPPS